jgi:hypothetical protein
MARYIYQRGGAPLLQWRNGVGPSGSRAGETRGLGSLGGNTLDVPLPVPGGPEPLGAYRTRARANCCDGCWCAGSDPCCGLNRSLSGDISAGPILTLGAVAVAAWFLFLRK